MADLKTSKILVLVFLTFFKTSDAWKTPSFNIPSSSFNIPSFNSPSFNVPSQFQPPSGFGLPNQALGSAIQSAVGSSSGSFGALGSTIKAAVVSSSGSTEDNFIPGIFDRAAVGDECWYPNYYCSFTQANIIHESGLGVPNIANAKECYDLCQSTADCKFFTWIKMRARASCYLLNECSNGLNTGPNYRIYKDACLNRNPRMCISGPANCSPLNNNTICSKPANLPEMSPHYVQWQCEDSKQGYRVNFYDTSVDIHAGIRCMQTCDAWVSERQAPDTTPRAYIFSDCQADGTWSSVKTYDRYDGATELSYPSLAHLNIAAYPKPDAEEGGSEALMICACPTLELKWPPSQDMADASGASLSSPFYYNPRALYGVDFECTNEVNNTVVDNAGKFEIVPSNTCKLFCDNYLVDTFKCANGKWYGDVDNGAWCYDYPTLDNAMNWQRTVPYLAN